MRPCSAPYTHILHRVFINNHKASLLLVVGDQRCTEHSIDFVYENVYYVCWFEFRCCCSFCLFLYLLLQNGVDATQTKIYSRCLASIKAQEKKILYINTIEEYNREERRGMCLSKSSCATMKCLYAQLCALCVFVFV